VTTLCATTSTLRTGPAGHSSTVDVEATKTTTSHKRRVKTAVVLSVLRFSAETTVCPASRMMRMDARHVNAMYPVMNLSPLVRVGVHSPGLATTRVWDCAYLSALEGAGTMGTILRTSRTVCLLAPTVHR